MLYLCGCEWNCPRSWKYCPIHGKTEHLINPNESVSPFCKLQADHAVDLSDAEIERVFKGCAREGKCIAAAKQLRDMGALDSMEFNPYVPEPPETPIIQEPRQPKRKKGKAEKIILDIDGALDKFFAEDVVCAACIHGIDKDLFGNIFCEQPGMAGGWNPPTACCEEHYFRNPKKRDKLDLLLERHYEFHRHEYEAES